MGTETAGATAADPLAALAATDALARLKHAYFRLLDTKEFEALGRLLTDDVTTAYASGELAFTGRQAVVDFLVESLGAPGIVTMHHGHHPELALDGPDAATGTWYLEDRVIVPDADFEIHGTAVYSDRYARSGDAAGDPYGGWRIAHTGYDRVFEQRRRHSTGELLSFSSRFTSR